MKGFWGMVGLSFFIGSCGLASFRTAELQEDVARELSSAEIQDADALPATDQNQIGEENQQNGAANISEIEAKAEESVVTVEKELTANAWQTKACTENQLQTLQWKLMFPRRKSCHFAAGENLAKRAGHMQAHEKQVVQHILPDGIALCSMELSSQDQRLKYDDYLFLTLNDRILIASEINWAAFFLTEQGTKRWNWAVLRGQSHAPIEASNQYGVPYCLGDSNCQVPKHNEAGSFSYTLPFAETNPDFYKSLENDKTLNFALLVTGDDDHHDCSHTDFDLDLVLTYVVPSKNKK